MQVSAAFNTHGATVSRGSTVSPRRVAMLRSRRRANTSSVSWHPLSPEVGDEVAPLERPRRDECFPPVVGRSAAVRQDRGFRSHGAVPLWSESSGPRSTGSRPRSSPGCLPGRGSGASRRPVEPVEDERDRVLLLRALKRRGVGWDEERRSPLFSRKYRNCSSARGPYMAPS